MNRAMKTVARCGKGSTGSPEGLGSVYDYTGKSVGLSQRLVAELCEKNCREYRVHRTCRIHGENMAVNFGPQADGDFRPEEKMLLRELGEWTEKYGKCIQG